MLTPLSCGTSRVFGSVTYEDAYGTVKSIPIQPKEISIKCPLVKPQIASQSEVNTWINNLKLGSSTINFHDIPTAQAFQIGRDQVSALDLTEVRTNQEELWSLYSGEVKVTGNKMVVKLSVDHQSLMLDVWADDLKQTTGFLAYLSNLINLALESSYKMVRDRYLPALTCDIHELKTLKPANIEAVWDQVVNPKCISDVLETK